MNEKIIKSSDRVKDHGEVFTPKRIVDLMLDQPEIMKKLIIYMQRFWNLQQVKGHF